MDRDSYESNMLKDIDKLHIEISNLKHENDEYKLRFEKIIAIIPQMAEENTKYLVEQLQQQNNELIDALKPFAEIQSKLLTDIPTDVFVRFYDATKQLPDMQCVSDDFKKAEETYRRCAGEEKNI